MDWTETVAARAAADLFQRNGLVTSEVQEELLGEIHRIHREASTSGFGSVRWIVHGCTGCGSTVVTDRWTLHLIKTDAVLNRCGGQPIGVRLCPVHAIRLKHVATSLDQEIIAQLSDVDDSDGGV